MGNAIFEQYGYKSARDLLTELARDISDGGELITAVRISPTIKFYGYRFDGGYWSLLYRRINRRDCIYSLDYHDTLEELERLAGAFVW